MVVRAYAQYNITPLTDPEPYQQFFAALSKSISLGDNSSKRSILRSLSCVDQAASLC
jgi:hypothetical protein